ncbi:hypothetical protein MNBD_GAMMA14-837 [hydrothermal vent metagenome]|uniref:Type 4 fimbrial biogenesis protein PilX N-terminal domain-containing protein n=1 Tax=hydrothermal vent metagenome TaxID=652676 RepID=A0A3B0YL94_9ZZZZ
MLQPKIKHLSTPLYRQSGIVLVFSLFFLLILTLVGVSSMRGTSLEEKMTSNMRDRMSAFQAAESSLRDGELFINTVVSQSVFNGTNGLFGLNDLEPDFIQTAVWSDDALSATATPVPGTRVSPRYFIKRYGNIKGGAGAKNIGNGYKSKVASSDVIVFRVTSRGTGNTVGASATAPTEVILRSYFGRIF